jgi:protein-disulfide isomerase
MSEEIIQKPINNKKESLLIRMRENPWMLSTLVLGVLLFGAVLFGSSSNGVGGGGVSESVVEGKVLGFLSSRVTDEVTVNSIEKKDSYYEVIVNFQGDQIPIYAGLNGDFIFTELIPTDPTLANPGLTQDSSQAQAINVEIGSSPVEGDPNAPITIIEFSDYQCPFCQSFYTNSLPQIQENYIDTGIAKLVFKDFPLDIHPQAQRAAEAARCFAEQGDYFKYHDKIFESQHLLADEIYVIWAIELGANPNLFNDCLDSGKYTADVQADLAYGSSLGVTGTPAFFVNGKLISGAQPYSVFEQIIEELTA